MEATGLMATADVGAAPLTLDGIERRRQAWRRIVLRQLTRLCARAEGSDSAARDAAARAARLAAQLELDETGALTVR